MASSWGTSWLTSWGNSWGDTGGVTPTPTPAVDGPHGPGWKLFGQDARPSRKRKVETLEADLVRSYEDATGITAERERLAAIRELKRVAATAASVAKAEQDERLGQIAQQIIALKKFELTANAYLDRVGDILAVLQDQEDDDMEALEMIARLV